MPFLIVHKQKQTDAIIRLQSAGEIPAGTIVMERSPEHSDVFLITEAVSPFDSCSFRESEKQLKSLVLRSLQKAEEAHCESITLLPVYDGIAGYPENILSEAAESAIRLFLEDHDLMIYLVREQPVSEKKDVRLEKFLSQNLEPEMMSACALPEGLALFAQADEVDDAVRHLDESFQSALFRIIDAKGLADAEVYRKANLDRRLFSKIRTQKDYRPGKRTILALCIALKLNREETEDLLEKGGYSLSMSQVSDVIIAYFITHGNYDIYEINDALFRYDQQLLGS